MSLHDRPITVALLGATAVSAATIYGFFDPLHSTRRDWQMRHGRSDTASPVQALLTG